jgi:hypothetical protein
VLLTHATAPFCVNEFFWKYDLGSVKIYQAHLILSISTFGLTFHTKRTYRNTKLYFLILTSWFKCSVKMYVKNSELIWYWTQWLSDNFLVYLLASKISNIPVTLHILIEQICQNHVLFNMYWSKYKYIEQCYDLICYNTFDIMHLAL